MPDHATLTESMNAQIVQLKNDKAVRVLQEQIDALKRRIETLEGSSKQSTKKG